MVQPFENKGVIRPKVCRENEIPLASVLLSCQVPQGKSRMPVSSCVLGSSPEDVYCLYSVSVTWRSIVGQGYWRVGGSSRACTPR